MFNACGVNEREIGRVERKQERDTICNKKREGGRKQKSSRKVERKGT